MDKIDLEILNLLKVNSRSTASEISKKVNLSIPAVSERIHKLEDNHIIEQYTIKINRKEMNYNLMACVLVSIDDSNTVDLFSNAILEFNQVLECYHISGHYDYMLKVLIKDTAELDSFLLYDLKTIPGVKEINTTIILSTIKETENRL